LGLDLGIASVGWCLFDDDAEGNPIRIRDIGSFVFDQIENPKSGLTENIDRRQKRLLRRQRRRRVRVDLKMPAIFSSHNSILIF
jgi:CRISPR/Cas system Type II protein with McrA/HNH and RuvC-like nuclease domain